MMFEHFTGDARNTVVQAQQHARRLGHRYIGCEHLLLAAASAGEPASAALRQHGVTPQAVETEIVRLVGLGQVADLFNALDREALASIGIDLDAVRERAEAAFGPDAFTRVGPSTCRKRRPRHPRRAGRDQHANSGGYATGHIPFTPRAKQSLADSLREAKARHDSYIGVEHLTLALVAMNHGAVPPILSALGTSPAILRAAILDRYRQAS
jgi:ATP-dependent Clp protease ATP-binding subunit ClpA